MRNTRPELLLERMLLALEHEVMEATEEEILAAASSLGMNPAMKGSSAFFGVTLLVQPNFLAGQKRKRSARSRPRA